MQEELQKLIQSVCKGFPSFDVKVSQINDMKRFARMAHYAWKNQKVFNPDMFKEVLLSVEKFQNLSEEEIEGMANELCSQADFATSLFHAAFDLNKSTI